jgi:nucleoside-diphosphate-sugar epimerase
MGWAFCRGGAKAKISSMKVLVTGATGFIGQHVIPLLLAQGYKVTAVARDEIRARGFAWFNRVRFIACDVHQLPGGLLKLFRNQDAVVHLAWPGLPNYKELFHFEETLPADYDFLKSLVEGGMSHLLVTGTCFEYGLLNGCLSEDLPTQPANPYALAKDTLRKYMEALQQQHPFTLQWARLFYMYGKGQSPSSLLAQLDRAIDNEEPVFNMSGGEQLRDYLSVEEVARRLILLLRYRQCNGVINVCSGKPISVRCLVEQHLAKRTAEIQLNLGHFSYPDYEPMEFWGDPTKFDRMTTGS